MQKTSLLLVISILIIMFPSCVVPTYFGKSSFQETQKNQNEQPVKNILIIGAGSTSAHAFLDNLSDELTKLFNDKKIQCSYNYIGKINKGKHIDVNKLASNQFDSYLLINPTDSSIANLNKDVGIYAAPLVPGVGVSGPVKGTQYKEKFSVEFYIAEDNKPKQVWQSELKVDFDFSTNHRYKVIAQSIFDKVTKNS